MANSGEVQHDLAGRVAFTPIGFNAERKVKHVSVSDELLLFIVDNYPIKFIESIKFPDCSTVVDLQAFRHALGRPATNAPAHVWDHIRDQSIERGPNCIGYAVLPTDEDEQILAMTMLQDFEITGPTESEAYEEWQDANDVDIEEEDCICLTRGCWKGATPLKCPTVQKSEPGRVLCVFFEGIQLHIPYKHGFYEPTIFTVDGENKVREVNPKVEGNM